MLMADQTTSVGTKPDGEALRTVGVPPVPAADSRTASTTPTFRSAPLLFLMLLLLTACNTTPPAPVEHDPRLDIVMPSRQLTDPQALTLEFDLMTSPSNIQYRVDLLWHYRSQFGSPDAERTANRHVLWLIENRPRAAVLATPVAEMSMLPDRTAFEAAKATWLKVIEAFPNDAKVLGNAGAFFLSDDTGRAVELLEQANRLEPENPTWARHLAEGYRARALSAKGDQSVVLGRLALGMYERAAELAPSAREKIILLLRAATLATRTTDTTEQAVTLAGRADELLPSLDADADAAAFDHNIHVIIGLGAIRQGRLEFARDNSLSLAAAAVRGQTVSLSDLDMSLVAVLYERGEKDAVLAYLKACETAAKSTEVTRWMQFIRAGEKPDFSAYRH